MARATYLFLGLPSCSFLAFKLFSCTFWIGCSACLAPGARSVVLIAVTAALLGANAYFLAFYTLEQPTTFRVLCAVAAGSIFLAAMPIPRARPLLAIFAGIMLVLSLAQYGYAQARLAGLRIVEETVSLPVRSDRNVYIIGFESLHSPTAYRRNFGVEEAAL